MHFWCFCSISLIFKAFRGVILQSSPKIQNRRFPVLTHNAHSHHFSLRQRDSDCLPLRYASITASASLSVSTEKIKCSAFISALRRSSFLSLTKLISLFASLSTLSLIRDEKHWFVLIPQHGMGDFQKCKHCHLSPY